MTDADSYANVPLSQLPVAEKSKRAGSFGGAASLYERYRPGPPLAAVEWFVPERVTRIVDLGAGTGALTRLLRDRADDIVAVEPDARMRAVLTEQVEGVRAVDGRGDAMPLDDHSVDAVLASSSWHWMDVVPTLREVHRILVPGGILGAVWSGPDPDGPFLAQARSLLAQRSTDDGGGEFAGRVLADADRPSSTLEIPPGSGFAPPEHDVITWDVALTADDLIGLLGTFSWIITMPDDQRAGVLAEARRLLDELLGVKDDVTVDVAFRAEVWRTHALTAP